MSTISSLVVQDLTSSKQRFIIYPEDNRIYRMWRHFLLVLTFYICSVSIVPGIFMTLEPLYFILTNTIVCVFFIVDLFLSFFVAYIDKKTFVIVDIQRRIFINHVATFVLRTILIIPFEVVGYHYYGSSTYRIFIGFTFLRLSYFTRIKDWFIELEENENINFVMVRLVKMALVCLFICHYGGCIFYFIATLHAPKGTWFSLAGENFLELGIIERYSTSIYWAVTSFSTVGFGDLHPVTLAEKIFSILFLFHNIGVTAYVATSIGNLVAPNIGPIGRYRTRRSRVLCFCRRHNLPTQLQDEVSAHLKLEYLSNLEPLEDHGILMSLPTPLKARILNFLYNKVSDNYLFMGVSNPTRFQLVLGMDPVLFPANTTVILQYELPTCLYFVVRGSVDLIFFQDEVEHVVRTVEAEGVFGESSVFINKPQQFTVRTREISELLKLDRVTLLNILQGKADDASIIMNNHVNLLMLELIDPHTDDFMVELKMKATTGSIDLPVSFWFALDRGYTSLFERLVGQYPNGPDPNGCDDTGRTALHIAASLGEVTNVERLLQIGADPNRKDFDEKAPLWYALLNGHEGVIQVLERRGAAS